MPTNHPPSPIDVPPGVYRPQEDSFFLAGELEKSGLAPGRTVLDLCAGSGILAIEAARLGAKKVVALDISPQAVDCIGRNAARNHVQVDVRRGSIDEALRVGPFDIVLCNPPYVPAETLAATVEDRAWSAGPDGRLVLDPLCRNARSLVADGGALLLVQSEFADPDLTTAEMNAQGFACTTVASLRIAFGPVLRRQADLLRRRGKLQSGVETEELVVIRAQRR